MSTIKDRTQDFKDTVCQRALSIGYDFSKSASLFPFFTAHKPPQPLPFTKAALKAVDSIQALEECFAKYRKIYADLQCGSEREWNRIEPEVEGCIETCKEKIDLLNNLINEEEVSSKGWLWFSFRGDSNADTRAHKQEVVLILSERLHSVSSLFNKSKAKPFPNVINKVMHRSYLAMVSNNKSVDTSKNNCSDQADPEEIHSDKTIVQQQYLDGEAYALQVPHYKQQSSWDCGLTCILMILRTVGISSCNIQDLKDMCNINSIWTVDLAYLLQKFSIKFSYFTVTLGANPAYSDEKFYEDQFSDDLVRVEKLFCNARKAGIDIQCRSISEQEISLFILSGKHVAVALVDQSKLSDSWLNNVFISDFLGCDTAYTGHYIVVCGYNTATDEFEIRDPASSRRSRMITSKCLKEARKSFGTDEDLLMVSLENAEDQEYPAV